MPTSSIAEVVAALASGGNLLVIDDEDRENEGDLITAAEHAGTDEVAFFLEHTPGFLGVALDEHRSRELDLDLMVIANTESQAPLSSSASTPDAAPPRAQRERSSTDDSRVGGPANRARVPGSTRPCPAPACHYGISIHERVPPEVAPNGRNSRYLTAKRDRMGHLLQQLT